MFFTRLHRLGTTLALLAVLTAPLPAAWAAPVVPKQHGGIPAEDWQSVETDNAVIFYLDNTPGREDLAQIKETIEKDVDKVATLLQVRLPKKMNVMLYPDRLKAPGYRWGIYVRGDDIGDLNTMHVTYDDAFRRRMYYKGGSGDLFLGGVTAIFAFVLNPSPSFVLTQGLALYVADLTYPGGPLESYAKQYMEDGKLPVLGELDLMNEEALTKKGKPAEVVPGAFARFLIRNWGFEKYLQAYRKATDKTMAAVVQDLYGKSLATLEGEFHAYLKGFLLPRIRSDKDRGSD